MEIAPVQFSSHHAYRGMILGDGKPTIGMASTVRKADLCLVGYDFEVIFDHHPLVPIIISKTLELSPPHGLFVQRKS